MFLTDIIIISCIGVNMMLGYRKGFIWSIFGLASYLIAALCGKFFYEDVAIMISNYTGLLDRLEVFMEDNFIMEAGEGTFAGMGLVGELLMKDLEFQTYAHQTAEMVKEEIVKGLATLLLNIISMILIFIVVKIAIVLIGTMLDQLFKLPILNGLNKTGGILIGGLKGLFLAMVIFVIMFVMATLSPDGAMASAMENSFMLQFFFNDLFPPLINWLL